ncbi:MAG TPA: hypothetical protein VEU30_12495 [Thermoanaerobaculia bacterium]|nr:hypothetical protein [Thermoanaerobaculia bacterium]
MSKTNPNQDFYKIGGRSQTDGPDRGEQLNDDRQQFAQVDKNAHPAVKRAAKKK